MPASATKFWELAGIFLSVAQMIISLERVRKYEKKLEEMADVFFKCGDNCPGESLAVKHRCRYRELRNLDAAFNAWYDNVPQYDVCESGIHRGKGKVSEVTGDVMRKFFRQNNGYTPLAMVGNVSSVMVGYVKATAATRAYNHNAEMKRKMEDQLLHWKKVVTIPVEREGTYADFGGPIKAWLQTAGEWGQGFNSGAAGFGSSLYRLLHSRNMNQQEFGPIPQRQQEVVTVGWGIPRR